MALRLQRDNPEGESPRGLPEFVPTPIAERILRALAIVHEVGGLAFVRGSAGLGKTTALREYSRRHEHVHLFTLNEMVRGKRDILAMLCDRFMLQGHSGPSYQIIDNLLRVLKQEAAECALFGRSEPARVLLVFDEVQHMTPEAISLMRSLADVDDEKVVAVVFAGNTNTLKGAARDQRTASAARIWYSSEWDQVISRFTQRCDLDKSGGIKPEDVEAYLEACGIGGDRADLMGFLWGYAERPGALRNVRKILNEALRASDSHPFTLDTLRAAVESLSLDVPVGRS